ncbi:MAG: helix-turn-helix domain-containing protein [Clostridiales bacterium]|nr:helix-turn-helix domain-containing protein [Clostridiales bacterium]
MTETTRRILNLMHDRQMNAYQLETIVGLPNATIQSWVKGKKRKDGTIYETNPSADSITALARFFNVSADYLLCLTDEPTSLKTANTSNCCMSTLSTVFSELLQDERFVNFVKLYKVLPTEYCAEVYGYIRGVATKLGFDIKQILG